MSDPLRSAKVSCSISLSLAAWACLLSAVFFSPLGASAPARSDLLLATLAAQDPGDYELIRRALELYRVGNCEAAEALLEKILLHQPKNTAVRKLLANCLLLDKKIDEARIQFQLVLEDAPQDTEALLGLRASVTEIQRREELKQKLAIAHRVSGARPDRAIASRARPLSRTRAHLGRRGQPCRSRWAFVSLEVAGAFAVPQRGKRGGSVVVGSRLWGDEVPVQFPVSRKAA